MIELHRAIEFDRKEHGVAGDYYGGYAVDAAGVERYVRLCAWGFDRCFGLLRAKPRRIWIALFDSPGRHRFAIRREPHSMGDRCYVDGEQHACTESLERWIRATYGTETFHIEIEYEEET